LIRANGWETDATDHPEDEAESGPLNPFPIRWVASSNHTFGGGKSWIYLVRTIRFIRSIRVTLLMLEGGED
jgi:hypothetical protein